MEDKENMFNTYVIEVWKKKRENGQKQNLKKLRPKTFQN